MKTFLKILLLSLALALSVPALAAKNILVFGDSLSAGYGIARDDSWSSLLQRELKESHPRYAVVNASVSGETSSGGLRRIAKALQHHRPAVVILELGANDGLRGTPLDVTEKNLATIIMQSRKAGAKVLLVGIKLPPNYGLDYTRRFDAIFPILAKRYKIPLMPFLLEGIKPEQFQPDNLHPTAEAQPLIMRNVLEALAPLLH